MNNVRELWDELSNIPIDENDCIELPFQHFPPGTDRFEIWHWFEDEFDVVVSGLLSPNSGG